MHDLTMSVIDQTDELLGRCVTRPATSSDDVFEAYCTFHRIGVSASFDVVCILSPESSPKLPTVHNMSADNQTAVFLGDKILAQAMTSDLEKVEGK
jgi:hypothetical protein